VLKRPPWFTKCRYHVDRAWYRAAINAADSHANCWYHAPDRASFSDGEAFVGQLGTSDGR
jgi:hypothetical protein